MRRLLPLISILALLCSCAGSKPRYIRFTGTAQGGLYSVTCNIGATGLEPESVRRGVEAILTEVDTCLSGYNRGSVLGRLNAGEKVVLPPLFSRAYRESYDAWLLSRGAFDISAGPLYNAWGFGFRDPDRMPDEKTVDSLRAICGMHRLIHPDKMDSLVGVIAGAEDFLKIGGGPSPILNFNAIAQGLTCDLVSEYLFSLGIKDMMVDIGEIFCSGKNPRGEGWVIGIDNPVDGNNIPGADIRDTWKSDGIGARGVVTSGNYRKFYIRDGVKYSHTIDPRSGYPVRHDLLSATVIASSASLADALATVFMVLGAQQSQEFIKAWNEGNSPPVSACLIRADSVVWAGEPL